MRMIRKRFRLDGLLTKLASYVLNVKSLLTALLADSIRPRNEQKSHLRRSAELGTLDIH